jgi:hypothetical protein
MLRGYCEPYGRSAKCSVDFKCAASLSYWSHPPIELLDVAGTMEIHISPPGTPWDEQGLPDSSAVLVPAVSERTRIGLQA